MNEVPRYMCVMPGCPGEHASKYLCCDFPEHQPGKWVGSLSVKTGGINIGVCDETNYRIAWTHFPEYAEALVKACNNYQTLLTQRDALEAREKVLREALKESRDILAMFGPAAFNIMWCAINWNDHNFKEEVLRGKGKRAADLLGFDRLTGVGPVNKVIDRMEKSLDASDAALATGEAK